MRLHLSLLLFGMVVGAAGPPNAAAEIPIGLGGHLTGPYAASGQGAWMAAEMAVDDLNAGGGVLGQQVTMIAADDRCGLQESVEAARQLVAAGVRFVVGHMCSHSSLLAAGLYETADILMITAFSTHPRLTEEGRQNVFRLIGRDDEQGRLAGGFLADRWAGKEIAILHDGSTYGERLALETRQQLRARGETEAIYDVFSPKEDDYTALAARLQRVGIDVLYLGGSGRDAGRILRAARASGNDLQLIGGDGVGMVEFWQVADRLGEGTIFSNRRDVRARPDAADVLARLRARGVDARLGSLAVYAAVQAWSQAVALAGTLELAAVAGTLRRGRFDTVLGPVAFDDKGDLLAAGWQWNVWTNGEHMPLEQFSAMQSHRPSLSRGELHCERARRPPRSCSPA